MILSIVIAAFNFLGALIPKLPEFIDELDGHDDLTPEGQAALDLIKTNLDADNDRLQKIQPLVFEPAPVPAPTAPSTPSSTSLAASKAAAPTPPVMTLASAIALAPVDTTGFERNDLDGMTGAAATGVAPAAESPAAPVAAPVDPANEVD